MQTATDQTQSDKYARIKLTFAVDSCVHPCVHVVHVSLLYSALQRNVWCEVLCCA